MTRFADTFYFLALLNSSDSAHAAAMQHSQGLGGIITTEWVLTEAADAMAQPAKRQGFLELHRLLRAEPKVVIIPADSELFLRGVELYAGRPDKEWSLTDCISFVVMRDRGIAEALTGDHHFEQAGFVALLRSET